MVTATRARVQEGLGSMPRCLRSVPTAWASAAASDFMADARNLVRWDPGVKPVSVAGDGPGSGTSSDRMLGLVLRRFGVRAAAGLGRVPGGEPSETP